MATTQFTNARLGRMFDHAITTMAQDNGYSTIGKTYAIPKQMRDTAIVTMNRMIIGGWNPEKVSIEVDPELSDIYQNDLGVLALGEAGDQERLIKKLGRYGKKLHSIFGEVFDGEKSYVVDDPARINQAQKRKAK